MVKKVLENVDLSKSPGRWPAGDERRGSPVTLDRDSEVQGHKTH